MDIPKRALMVLDYMKENQNFMTFSAASASKNEVEKLKNLGLIAIGVCSGGMLDGVEGYIVANPDRKPVKEEFVAIVEPKKEKKWKPKRKTTAAMVAA